MKKKEVTVTYSFLRRCALIYVTLPLLCFLAGWLKWYWMILSCAALVVCLIFSEENMITNRFLKRNAEHPDDPKQAGNKIVISKLTVSGIALISCIYCIFCGVGRLWAQSDDYAYRNAIFRDIILRDWPVIYDRYDGALSYYIGLFLPPAVPGKLVYLLSGSAESAFIAGNIAILIYCTAGLTLLFLLLLLLFRTASPKLVILVMIGLFLFSGMDIIGNGFQIRSLHLEWWAGFATYQYSSLTTCFCWVLNQTLIPWICTALLLHEKSVSNYVLLGMSCLLSGPFPFVGFFIYCVALGIKCLVDRIRAGQGKGFIKEVFSVSNVCATLFVAPFICTYMTSNAFVSNSSAKDTITIMISPDIGSIIRYVSFLLIEFGIYALLIAKVNKKNYLFYITVLQLCVYPIFNIGVYSDFTMRSSIPAIFIMFVLCYQFILNRASVTPPVIASETKRNKKEKQSRFNDILCTVLVCLLAVGAATPCVELVRGCVQVKERGINDPETDYLVTLNQDSNPFEDGSEWPMTSFVAVDLDDSFFYRYFARR